MTSAADEKTLQEKDRELYKKTLLMWKAALKSSQLYSAVHPSTIQTNQNFIGLLSAIFQNKIQLDITHSDGLFMIDDFLFIEESLLMYDLLHILEEKKIRNILFLPGITK